MHPDAPSSRPDAARGLPPVQPPPSASHVVKQFVVPLLIVAALVGGFVMASSLFPGCTVLRSPDRVFAEFDSANPDRRWRAAQDLAQVLPRDDLLASDPSLGLGLADRLRRAVEETDRAEQELAKRVQESPNANVAAQKKEVEASREYLLYLSACAASLCTPVGVEPLKKMAEDGGSGPPRAQAMRRWRGLWALANLGENLKRFDKLSAERQDQVLAGFEQEASGLSDRAATAREALAYLKSRRDGKPGSLGVDEVLIRCSADHSPFLREIAAFAMNFWDAESPSRVEEALLARLHDRGEGEEQQEEFYADSKGQDRQFTKTPGLKVRYNAAAALARRGSDRAPVELLKQMMDEPLQLEEHRVRYAADGREAADEATAYQTITAALKATAELRRKNSRINLGALFGAVEKLKDCSRPGVKAEAERTWQVLQTGN